MEVFSMRFIIKVVLFFAGLIGFIFSMIAFIIHSDYSVLLDVGVAFNGLLLFILSWGPVFNEKIKFSDKIYSFMGVIIIEYFTVIRPVLYIALHIIYKYYELGEETIVQMWSAWYYQSRRILI